MPTHRLTIRLDDTAWADLGRICDTAGVSATAFLQAFVNIAGPIWAENGWVPPERWPEGPFRDATIAAVESARRIDNERRRRA